MDQINPNDKVCFNCKYFAWLVGIGQGIRCFHPLKIENGKMRPVLPSKIYTCELFEYKINSQDSTKQNKK